MKSFIAVSILRTASALLALGFSLGSSIQAQIFYVSVNGGGTIQKVSSPGVISTFASGLVHPSGLAFSGGNLFVSEANSGTLTSVIYQITPSGTVSTFATGFQLPIGLAFDTSGNLFVADYGLSRISKVTSGGVVSTFATGLNSPFGLAFGSSGNLFVANRDNGTISEVQPNGSFNTFASGFNQPNDLAFGQGGNLFVSNFGNNTISKVSGGTVSTFVDHTHGLTSVVGLAFDTSTGNLFAADQGTDSILKIAPDGSVSTFATGVHSGPQYLAITPVPEPSMYATIAGAVMLGWAIWQRRRQHA